MRVALGISHLFPGGGLQRDCIEIAKLIRRSGHDVTIYAERLTGGPFEFDIPIVVLSNSAWTNHGRLWRFSIAFSQQTSTGFDLVVGFDKLLGLDVLYCANPSVYYRILKQPYLRVLPRYRSYARLEGHSFERGRNTQIILLSRTQRIEYQSVWCTESERLIELPSTLSPMRRHPNYRINGIRERVRTQLGLGADECVWLAITVQPRTKGLDRVLRALRHFPQARLLVAGLEETDHRAKRSANRARQLGVAQRVIWLGHREDIAHTIAASDVLVHPARYDTTGTVILEALVNGLPVITTSVCGNATHVHAAGAGIIVGEPFDFRVFLAALRHLADAQQREVYSRAGVSYGQNTSLYEGRIRAAEIILDLAAHKISRMPEWPQSPIGRLGRETTDLGMEWKDNVIPLPALQRKQLSSSNR